MLFYFYFFYFWKFELSIFQYNISIYYVGCIRIMIFVFWLIFWKANWWCSKEILIAYVGIEHVSLYIWLSLWLVLILCQVHSTPTNALILAKGKTKELVIVSAAACIISIILNMLLAEKFNVGSAVLGYTVYILITLTGYYVFFYKQLLKLSRIKTSISFVIPSLLGFVSMFVIGYCVSNISIEIGINIRINMILVFLIKSVMFLGLYYFLLWVFKIARIKQKKIVTIWG